MNRFFGLCLLVFTWALFAQPANAQTNVWKTGYPTSLAKSTLNTAGTATAEPGWELTGADLVVYWLAPSGVENVASVTVDKATGVWTKDVQNLMSGKTYNVYVKAVQKKGVNPQNINTTTETVPVK